MLLGSMMNKKTLVEYVKLVIAEAKQREDVELSNGKHAPFGSEKHIDDLEKRIADLTKWRDKQSRGSSSRADYTRVISNLKSELRTAKNVFEKAQSQQNENQ